MGPGFDALDMALEMWSTVRLCRGGPPGVAITGQRAVPFHSEERRRGR